MRNLQEIELLDRRVLIRSDLDGTGRMLARKLVAAAPAVREVLSKGGRPIIAAHASGVRGGLPTLRTAAEGLSAYLGWKVRVVRGPPSKWQAAVEGAEKDEVLILENMLLHPGERENDPGLAEQLANLADVYVDDDFASSRQALASTVGIVDKVSECAMGPRLASELDVVDRSMNDPLRPMVAVIGGGDTKAKLRAVRHLVTRADRILIGGAIAFTFLEAEGVEVGRSAAEDSLVTAAQEIVEMAKEEGTRLVFPTDVLMGRIMDAGSEAELVSVKDINPRWMGLDIGPETVNHFLAAIKDARTIIWNGTMGAWEIEQFSQGTEAMAFAIARSYAFSVVGGRGTVSALERSGEIDQACHVSLGGDSFKAMLSGERLPGAEALGWRYREPQ